MRSNQKKLSLMKAKFSKTLIFGRKNIDKPERVNETCFNNYCIYAMKHFQKAFSD